jgi:hypothetical protein
VRVVEASYSVVLRIRTWITTRWEIFCWFRATGMAFNVHAMSSINVFVLCVLQGMLLICIVCVRERARVGPPPPPSSSSADAVDVVHRRCRGVRPADVALNAATLFLLLFELLASLGDLRVDSFGDDWNFRI